MCIGFKGFCKRQCWDWLGILLCLPLLATAGEEVDGAHDALQALLGELEQQTQIATRSKMNIDFVPGIVSVLYGGDLLDRGVRNAAEALALIPGIELSISSDGTTQVFVRGIGSVFASGKVKVMLNDVAFNSTLSVATTALAIPVEQIDRIEVIRGPGSTIYGEFAYSGVVNIVTRKRQKQVFARYGNLGHKTLGGVFTLGRPGEDWFTSLSLSGAKMDGGGVQTGPDVLRGTPITRAPGETNEEEVNRTLILNTAFRNFDFSVQWADVESGDYFGLANALPGNGQKLVRDVDMLSVDAGWRFSPMRELDGRVRMGWLNYKLDSGLHQLYPPGFAGSFPNGMLASPNHEERKYHVGLELNYTGFERHEILLGTDWYQTRQGDVFAVRNYDPATNPPTLLPLQKFTGSENWLEEDLQRRLWAVFVQDQFSWSDRLTFTAGIRFDSYDDVGDATSPRVAAVFQLSEQQTVKVQYARAFRPPTFLETSTKNNAVVTGNPDIESETIDNYELAYIYNDGMSVGRATFFYADLQDLIVVDTTSSPNTYANKGEVHVVGAELEYSRSIGRKLKLDSNLTLLETEDEDENKPVAGVASVLANLGVSYRFSRRYSLSAQYRFVGDRNRSTNDLRDDLPGYQTVDLTFSLKHLFEDSLPNGVDMRLGVRNLFDERVVYPAPMTSFGGSVIPSYPEDYPRPGREYWLQMDARF
ncbi:MAG TPA: TonB-dependent receptor [Gammaproteobacteria bacterium]|nr:TonB-dependent receptor [Gammaproteobacteria bacterium]